MKLAIVLPAYNEEKILRSVLESLPKKLTGIKKIYTIVTDDGSKDKTYAVAKKYATVALRHKINLGAGSATITGIRYATRKLNTDIVITMDSDGQHDPKNISALIKPIVNKKYDVVIGSRMLDSKGMPPIKIFTNKFANFITFIFSGIWASDTQTGFRAYSRKALRKIKLRTTGYEYCTEVFAELKRNNLKFIEVPVKVIYSDYSKAKGQPIANSINVLIKLINRNLTKL
ncbi:MAG: Glycosyl transferase family 2 [Berkelbacteria bacterium GW2011_GWA2_35_9]|uniref:Glycosyl transferase family 2 n=1 Tax=Berkelbacteria bacterium GW2011_GWA2_35_9 TaxID=1618333 RepID=A0A0G0FL34_9BACT|nr:MAG: Glycosyl transferase family 2 [Berkelbacteria bacterium GW2011_GWA2_35_9]